MKLKNLNKLLLIITASIIISNKLIADENPYKSLPIEEQKIVLKALKQSKYYKYYESLANGNDKIKIIKIVKKSSLNNKFEYNITCQLLIEDKIFIRTFDLNLDAINEEDIWDKLEYYGKILALILLGYGAGALSN